MPKTVPMFPAASLPPKRDDFFYLLQGMGLDRDRKISLKDLFSLSWDIFGVSDSGQSRPFATRDSEGYFALHIANLFSRGPAEFRGEALFAKDVGIAGKATIHTLEVSNGPAFMRRGFRSKASASNDAFEVEFNSTGFRMFRPFISGLQPEVQTLLVDLEGIKTPAISTSDILSTRIECADLIAYDSIHLRDLGRVTYGSDDKPILFKEDGKVILQADEVRGAASFSDQSVTSAMLADEAVTSDKLAHQAVTIGKIANGAVTTQSLAMEAVTPSKIADDAVLQKHIGFSIGRTESVELSSAVSISVGSSFLSIPLSGSSEENELRVVQFHGSVSGTTTSGTVSFAATFALFNGETEVPNTRVSFEDTVPSTTTRVWPVSFSFSGFFQGNSVLSVRRISPSSGTLQIANSRLGVVTIART
jgi:hypothetical protein